jgi:putative DNA primase/helicase
VSEVGRERTEIVLPPPSAPMEVARTLVADSYSHPAGLTLRHWRGGWWQWKTTRWVELEQRAVAKAAYEFTEHAVYIDGTVPTAWEPTRHKIANLLDALAAIVYTSEQVAMPAWLDGTAYDGLLVSTANGLLDVGNRTLLSHTPIFFNSTAVPFEYDPAAGHPVRWRAFLAQLWPDDRDSARALQEWFGYTISGRLDLHKILLVVGPTRAGKGVTARILGALVGTENVAGPTLSSLNGDFGLAPLLGKTLAVVSDARLNGRNANVVVERLLSISGEDTLTVNRKYREQWTGKLPTRLMLCSNELPQLGDASTAIAGRFVPLPLTRSWFGQEDHGLETALLRELPAILNWSLDGLARLSAQGRFTRPRGADEAIIALQDLASPVAAFVRDRCARGRDRTVPVDELYQAWRTWADDNGHVKSSKQVFGRDLRAAVPGLRVVQRGRRVAASVSTSVSSCRGWRRGDGVLAPTACIACVWLLVHAFGTARTWVNDAACTRCTRSSALWA